MSRNKNLIKTDLNIIIPFLCKFAYANRNKFNVNVLTKGELFTLIRRHSKNCIGDNNFNINNILNIPVIEGVIQTIEFTNQRYGANYSESIFKIVNECLDELNFDFKHLAFESSLKTITGKIENYKLNI